MKKIKINYFKKQNGLYVTSLGNGTAHEFKSKRNATAFLNKTGKYLTQLLYETSELYRQAWNAYQDIWFLFSLNVKGENMLQIDMQCKESLQIIEKMRDYLVKRADNYSAFTKFELIFIELKKVLKILTRIHKKHSNTPAVYKLQALYREAMRLQRAISQYAEEDADFLIDIKKEAKIKHFSQNGQEHPAELSKST